MNGLYRSVKAHNGLGRSSQRLLAFSVTPYKRIVPIFAHGISNVFSDHNHTMGWGTALATSGLYALGSGFLALTADAAAQVWEVKIPKKHRPRGNDCGFMDGGRTIRFTVLPGMVQGALTGFVNGFLWNDYIVGNALWPSHFLMSTIINDCIILFFVYPVSFRVHRRPMKQNFIVASGASMLVKAFVQFWMGLFRTDFFLSGFLANWLPLLIFSNLMYRGAYPEIKNEFAGYKTTPGAGIERTPNSGRRNNAYDDDE